LLGLGGCTWYGEPGYYYPSDQYYYGAPDVDIYGPPVIIPFDFDFHHHEFFEGREFRHGFGRGFDHGREFERGRGGERFERGRR